MPIRSPIFTRANVAGFLQGLFVLPLCALFGGLIALLFRWHGAAAWTSVAVCALFPLAGTIRTRQWALALGLLAGITVSVLIYLGVRP